MMLAPERDQDGRPDYRRAFKKGMIGTDVAALQINLEVPADGIFGSQTRQAVMKFQTAAKITIDGIAGLITQQHIIIARSREAASSYSLPKGMLRSLASNESGFAVAAFTDHPSDQGIDVGAFQRSSGGIHLPSQSWLHNAYDARYMADMAGGGLRHQFERFLPAPYVTSERKAWELAVLTHNWPEAAENLAFLGRVYDDPKVSDDAPQPWIEKVTNGRLHSAAEWIAAYIARSTTYVVW